MVLPVTRGNISKNERQFQIPMDNLTSLHCGLFFHRNSNMQERNDAHRRSVEREAPRSRRGGRSPEPITSSSSWAQTTRARRSPFIIVPLPSLIEFYRIGAQRHPLLPERFTSMRQDPGPTAGHLLAARIRSVVFDDLDQALVILLLKGAPEHQPRWPPWGDRISGPNLPRVRLKVDQKPLDLLAVVAQGGRAPLWRAKELLPSSAPQRVLPPPVPCRKGDGPGNGPGTAVGPSGLF